MEWKKLAVCVAACFAAAVIGSAFTAPAITAWYATLAKPWFSPPNWVFAPVWTLLYLLMAFAAYVVWMHGFGKPAVREAFVWFGCQLALNAVWSYLFFGLRSPVYGFIGIVFLWIAIAVTLAKFHSVDKKAALLMEPYLAWVSFAAVLNYTIMLMN